MKIVYINNDRKKYQSLVNADENFISLWKDKWDDYSNKTTFNTSCFISNKEIEIGNIKVLMENENISYELLDELMVDGWDGVFPIPNLNYISVPSRIEFYEQIKGNVSNEISIEVAKELHDASYLVHINDAIAIELTRTSAFNDSLLRTSGSNKAFVDGWKIFEDIGMLIEDFSFSFNFDGDQYEKINYHFDEGLLPQDINVLIGSNGVGKSQSLHKMVDRLLKGEVVDEKHDVFSKRPNISQVVVVSYSPFELFPVDMNTYESNLDEGAYRYFGFRERKTSVDKNKLGKVRVTRDRPKKNSAISLIECAIDDFKYSGIKGRSSKIRTLNKVLGEAMDFDYPALQINKKVRMDELYFDNQWLHSPSIDIDGERYIPFIKENIEEIKLDKLREHCIVGAGVVFIKDNQLLKLSSGQRLFSYIVTNILGVIRMNSLVIVDEPELFLHPTLEVSFVGLLKSILKIFSSKAILATHSLVIVREVPKNCVHVFSSNDNGLNIIHPPFETLGGDMQRISSYVFGDKSITKPYEEWLLAKLGEYGSAESLISALGDNINEEMLMQINAMDRKQW